MLFYNSFLITPKNIPNMSNKKIHDNTNCNETYLTNFIKVVCTYHLKMIILVVILLFLNVTDT